MSDSLAEICYMYDEWWPVLVITAYKPGDKWVDDGERGEHLPDGSFKYPSEDQGRECGWVHKKVPVDLAERYMRACMQMAELQVEIEEAIT